MGLIIDNFAGGGGASQGIEQALGRPVDFAINHDPEAIAMHLANHPDTRHLCENVFDVKPAQLCRGQWVDFGWFSPDCTFHSKARGGKPFRDRNRARRRRGLAGIVPRWLVETGMTIFALENVEEFADWGPLMADGRIDPKRRGNLFRRWHRQIENIVSRRTGLPYRIDMRELKACDYGAPTTRKRLFVIGRCDGLEIVFPDQTHGVGSGLRPYRTAAECIDWSIPCPSIFTRKRPLAEATMRRIARGVMRYVVNSPKPFLVPLTHQGDSRIHLVDDPMPTITGAHRGEHAIVAPSIARIGQTGGGGKYTNDAREPLSTITTKAEHLLIAPSLINTRNGERHGRHGEQAPRVRDIEAPFPTVTAIGSQGALVAAFLARHYGGHENDGSSLATPIHTITARDHHHLVSSHVLKLKGTSQDGHPSDVPLHTVQAGGTHYGEVRAFLMKYYRTGVARSVASPLDTITTEDRFGLVTVNIAGEPYAIVDIGMRMLTPRELYRAQSFPDGYVIDPVVDGKPLTKTAQVRMCGNSVCPAVAEALVRANVVEQREREVA